MKSNFLTKTYSKIKNQEYNYTKNFKNYMFSIVFVLLLAITVLLIFGFNKSIDASGGYIFRVNFNTEIESSEKQESVDIIKGILKDNKISKYEIVSVGDGSYVALDVKFALKGNLTESKTETLLENLSEKVELKLEEKLEYSHLSLTEPVKLYSNLQNNLVWNLILISVIAIVVFSIYTIIRFDMATMVAGATASLSSVIVFGGLTAILRLPITNNIIYFALMSMIVTMLFVLYKFDKVRDSFVKEQNLKLTNNQVLNKFKTQQFNFMALTLVASLILGVMITAIGKSMAIEAGLSIMLIAISSIFSSMFIAPSVWALMFNKDKDKKLQKRIELKNNPKQKTENDNIVI